MAGNSPPSRAAQKGGACQRAIFAMKPKLQAQGFAGDWQTDLDPERDSIPRSARTAHVTGAQAPARRAGA